MTIQNSIFPTDSRVLLTGSTGFFGKSILRYWMQHANLLPNNFQVTALSRDPELFLQRHPEFNAIPWLKLHKGNILSPNTLPSRDRYSHVIHAAFDTAKGEQIKPLEQYHSIIQGTENILKLTHETGAQRLLFVSSGAVYGSMLSQMNNFSEEHIGNLNPLNIHHTYGLAKRMAEHICTIYATQHQFELVIARGFAFVGQDLPLNIHFAIGNFIADGLANKDITIKGNGSPIRTWMSQYDLAHWLSTMLVEGKPFEAYNVGSDEQFSLVEAAKQVRDILAPTKKVILLSQETSQPNVYVPNIEKAKTTLGLSLKHTLREAVRHIQTALTQR